MPSQQRKRGKRKQPTTSMIMKGSSSPTSAVETYAAGVGGSVVRRIHRPGSNDVLSGRGGSINSHEGNVRFREWVAERKNAYTLAQTKKEKMSVAKEVIDLVISQDPPGRFLARDPSGAGAGHGHNVASGWWIELDDDRILSKTSQALREGAPAIRAAHQLEPLRKQRTPSRTRRKAPAAASKTAKVQHKRIVSDTVGHPNRVEAAEEPAAEDNSWKEAALEEMRHNVEEAMHHGEERDDTESHPPPAKRVRVDYNGYAVYPNQETPPLAPVVEDHHHAIVPLSLDVDEFHNHHTPLPNHHDDFAVPQPAIVAPTQPRLKRSHSLTLSDIVEWDGEDLEFVNPFEDEELDHQHHHLSHSSFSGIRSPPRVGVWRDSSVASNGDGGIGALFRSETVSSTHSNHDHEKYTNLSNHSLSSVLSDLPAPNTSAHPLEADFAEGMKQIYDALHPVVEDDEDHHRAKPSIKPYRGGGGGALFNKLRGRNGNHNSVALEGRQ